MQTTEVVFPHNFVAIWINNTHQLNEKDTVTSFLTIIANEQDVRTTEHPIVFQILGSDWTWLLFFLSHIDCHTVFVYSNYKKQTKKTSLRYNIIERNTVWSNVKTGNYLKVVVCMVSNRCQASTVSLKNLNYPTAPMWILSGAPGHLGTKFGNLIFKGY